jgi:hypothetical protein
MGVSIVSPELALVDPTLRTDLLAALPAVEPYSFLEFREPAPALLELRGPARAPAPVPLPLVVERPRRRPPMALAAAAYFVSAATRVVVMDALFVLGLAGAVACVQVLG